MTAKQAAVWSLYASGHRVTDIARATGRSKGSVSTMLKNIKAAIQNPVVKERLSVPCMYSPSCFTCPMRDCVIDSNRAAHFNALPADMERR